MLRPTLLPVLGGEPEERTTCGPIVGQESTILSAHVVLVHLGMVIVGLPYSFKGQMRMDEITGGSPYGASTLADDGSGGDRRPSADELAGARFQGRHVAELALALARGRRQLQPEPA